MSPDIDPEGIECSGCDFGDAAGLGEVSGLVSFEFGDEFGGEARDDGIVDGLGDAFFLKLDERLNFLCISLDIAIEFDGNFEVFPNVSWKSGDIIACFGHECEVDFWSFECGEHGAVGGEQIGFLIGEAFAAKRRHFV